MPALLKKGFVSLYSPTWHLVSNKNNVYVVCPKGAGHFDHPVEAVRSLRADGKLADGKGCTLILR